MGAARTRARISRPLIVSPADFEVESAAGGAERQAFSLIVTQGYDAEPNLLDLSAGFALAERTQSLFHP